jgi:small GTP-binding protein
VGKSALTIRLVQGTYVDVYDPTIEANYRSTVDTPGGPCVLDLLDTAGQEDFGSLREHQMKAGEGFVLVYSIAVPATFHAVERLHGEAKRFSKAARPVFVVCGNKCDVEEKRAISTAEGQDLSSRLGVSGFFETSAKTNTNVGEAFECLAREMMAVRNAYKKRTAVATTKDGPIPGRRRCTIL